MQSSIPSFSFAHIFTLKSCNISFDLTLNIYNELRLRRFHHSFLFFLFPSSTPLHFKYFNPLTTQNSTLSSTLSRHDAYDLINTTTTIPRTLTLEKWQDRCRGTSKKREHERELGIILWHERGKSGRKKKFNWLLCNVLDLALVSLFSSFLSYLLNTIAVSS